MRSMRLCFSSLALLHMFFWDVVWEMSLPVLFGILHQHIQRNHTFSSWSQSRQAEQYEQIHIYSINNFLIIQVEMIVEQMLFPIFLLDNQNFEEVRKWNKCPPQTLFNWSWVHTYMADFPWQKKEVKPHYPIIIQSITVDRWQPLVLRPGHWFPKMTLFSNNNLALFFILLPIQGGDTGHCWRRQI